MYSDLCHFVDGVGDAGCGSGVDDDIIDVAVDKILHCKGAALIAYAGSLEARKAEALVALDIELAGGAVLDADLLA